MNLKRRLATATAVGVTAATLTACADHHHVVAVPQTNAVAYAPPYLGENGMCYYVDSPGEVANLIAGGLCQPGWRPVVMPLDWHYRYADYIASPAYYNVYALPGDRGGWGRQWGTQSTFYTTNITIIHAKEKTATYKGSDGKTVTGNITTFAPPKTKAPTSAPLPAGARSSAPLPVGGARSTAPAPAASTAKPLSGGGARSNPAPPRVSAR
jgi:hypothetical protein